MRIVWAWILTIPASAVASYITYRSSLPPSKGYCDSPTGRGPGLAGSQLAALPLAEIHRGHSGDIPFTGWGHSLFSRR